MLRKNLQSHLYTSATTPKPDLRVFSIRNDKLSDIYLTWGWLLKITAKFHKKYDSMTSAQKASITRLGGVAPVYNLKSTAVACPGTDYVFLFGGYDELENLDSNVYLLNLKTRKWEIDDKHVGLYREGHLAVYVGDGNVLVFGGVPQDVFPETSLESSLEDSDSSNPGFRKDSLMMIYNVIERKWHEPPRQFLANAPSSRSRHACCLSEDGNKFYISGGLVNSVPLNDLYEYDWRTGIWSGPIEFAARFDHFITVLDNKLYAMGGLDKDMIHADRSILYYNFVDDTVGSVTIKPNSSKGQSFDPVDSETVFLDTVVNKRIKFKVCESKEDGLSGLQLSYANLVDYDFITIFGQIGLSKLLIEDSALYDPGEFVWIKPFVLSEGYLNLLGVPLHSDPKELFFSFIDDSLQLQLHSNENLDMEGMDAQSDNRPITQRPIYLLQIPISKLGIPLLSLNYSATESPKGTSKLLNDFKHFLQSEKYADFEIQVFASEEAAAEYSDTDFLVVPLEYKEIIGVHKAILGARWPHFQRILDSGMHETLTNKMQIPEPSSWIRAMLWYLYTGGVDIENYVPNSDLSTLGGMLVLANLYEMPDLRCEVLAVLVRKLQYFSLSTSSIDALIRLWKVILVANEAILLERTISLLREFWPKVSRCKEFVDLPKNLIVKLCQECSGPTFNPLDGSRNILLTPRSDRISVNSLSDEETPMRYRQSSPFLRQSPISPARHNSMDPLSSFPTLQSLPDDS